MRITQQVTSIRFAQVSIGGSKRGICQGCGEKAQRSTQFSQTINPYNKNNEGEVKDRRDILAELEKERERWKLEPLYHEKCEHLRRKAPPASKAPEMLSDAPPPSKLIKRMTP